MIKLRISTPNNFPIALHQQDHHRLLSTDSPGKGYPAPNRESSLREELSLQSLQWILSICSSAELFEDRLTPRDSRSLVYEQCRAHDETRQVRQEKSCLHPHPVISPIKREHQLKIYLSFQASALSSVLNARLSAFDTYPACGGCDYSRTGDWFRHRGGEQAGHSTFWDDTVMPSPPRLQHCSGTVALSQRLPHFRSCPLW